VDFAFELGDAGGELVDGTLRRGLVAGGFPVGGKDLVEPARDGQQLGSGAEDGGSDGFEAVDKGFDFGGEICAHGGYLGGDGFDGAILAGGDVVLEGGSDGLDLAEILFVEHERRAPDSMIAKVSAVRLWESALDFGELGVEFVDGALLGGLGGGELGVNALGVGEGFIHPAGLEDEALHVHFQSFGAAFDGVEALVCAVEAAVHFLAEVGYVGDGGFDGSVLAGDEVGLEGGSAGGDDGLDLLEVFFVEHGRRAPDSMIA
jgi:hypothetical protein